MSSKKEIIFQELHRFLDAGRPVKMETVDFNDPKRPKTCLEVDFPILPINQISSLEATTGATKKPIYQLMKWWARRQPSVFRSLIMAAAIKAPSDPSLASKLIWENYYKNHQRSGSFKNIKILDIFMGGGTTVVEGSRLGFQMSGNDLNPVAWFVTKQATSDIDEDEIKSLSEDICNEVKPNIVPYYYCDGPRGEKGIWLNKLTGEKMGEEFDPLSLPYEERKFYTYSGPEIIYTLFAKHGPCQVTGCGHRTPILSDPVAAVKTLTVKSWAHTCKTCGLDFDIEAGNARIAPAAPLYINEDERPFSVLGSNGQVSCPSCGQADMVRLGKGENKKVLLTLLVHPDWMAGSSKYDAAGAPYGGAPQDTAGSTAAWNLERATRLRLLEVRGKLPDTVTCPITNVTFHTGKSGGTVPKRSSFTCASCGTVQDVMGSIRDTGKGGQVAGYAFQGYYSDIKASEPYNGRFFALFDEKLARQYNSAQAEWEFRKNRDLAGFWPDSEIPYGFMTAIANSDIRKNHGYTHWWTMFNPRQLLVHSQILKGIVTLGNYKSSTREFLLAAFQQYLRNQCMFTIWDYGADQLTPMMSNNNFHPKATTVENCVFSDLGRGNWRSCVDSLFETIRYHENPWDNASNEHLNQNSEQLKNLNLSGKTSKVYPSDKINPNSINISCGSSTDLHHILDGTVDLVITDPPFGGLLHYSELSDFFYVWMRIFLKDVYPEYFSSEFTPKSMEAVANKAREPEDPDGFYQRLLTACWKEAFRTLKAGGILAFTFHHSEDEPWVAVLESLFDAGFYLEATYPIRSDETKGEGEFGSKTIEYDIIHVCRKRSEEPTPVSWGRMRREVMADVRQLQAMLENHAKEGLPAADLQVIKRGKALEYFSRHYGKVYVDEGRSITVKDALVGINQLIDEDADKGKEPPPVNAEPITRQFLRTFGTATEMKRDQLQKFLKGSITTPDEFEQRGWCSEKSKVFTRVNPLDFARDWSGKHKRRLTSDLDQALVLIGSCFDGSGINASDTLKNENFKPHVALKPLLEWLQRNGPDQASRNAASRALTIYNSWAASQATKPQQGSLFEEYDL